jgi:hypothetical protein
LNQRQHEFGQLRLRVPVPLRARALIAHQTYLQEQFAVLNVGEQAQLAELVERLRGYLEFGGATHV